LIFSGFIGDGSNGFISERAFFWSLVSFFRLLGETRLKPWLWRLPPRKPQPRPRQPSTRQRQLLSGPGALLAKNLWRKISRMKRTTLLLGNRAHFFFDKNFFFESRRFDKNFFESRRFDKNFFESKRFDKTYIFANRPPKSAPILFFQDTELETF